MRNLSKCKLFLCFRPVVDIDAMLESKVSEKLHGTKKPEAKTVFFQQGCNKFSKSWIMKQPPKKTLSRVIKAVVFETILNRRGHHKNRYLHDTFVSKQSYGSERKLAPQSPLSLCCSSSHGSTLSHSSSPKALLESPKNASNKCHPTKQNQKQKEKQNKFECFGIYLVLISLLFTVFWGKLFGIILTSMLLYFSSLWNSSSYCSQKRLPIYPKSTKAKGSRCHYGRSYIRSATRELP